MNRKPLPWVGVAAVLAVSSISSLAAVRAAGDGAKPPVEPTAAAGLERAIEPAISRPSEEAKLTFAAPGLVASAEVREGDAVKAGQPLLQQDDRIEQVALASAKRDAESDAEVKYQQADKAFKQTVYDRKQALYGEPGHPIALSEVEQAKMDTELSKAQIDVAQLHHDQKGMDYAKQQLKVELMQLRSPIDGVVQRIVTHAGEMSDPQRQDGAIVVVKNDPLWVEMNVAADRAEKLSMGQELQVRYKSPAGEPANPWMRGTISYFPPHADAASGTEMVRLTLPNPSGQRSGLAMEVRLPDNVAAVAQQSAGGGAAGLPPLPN